MEDQEAKGSEPRSRRLLRRFGPLFGGMLLDLVDLATFGPAGLYGGFLLGGAAGWWLGHRFGLGPRHRTTLALAAAAYSATPATEALPLGTLIGGLVQVARKPAPPSEEREAALREDASA
jgi:hypothetical protein